MLDDKKKGWIYVAIQFLLILLILAACYSDSLNIGDKGSWISILGLILCVMGFGLMLVSFFSFKQVMTPNPVPLDEYKLTTTGVYKYVRHPMYSSVLLALLGVVVYFKSYRSFMVWVVAVIFILVKVRFEEKSLMAKFPDYGKYSGETKKLIPFVY